MALTLSLCLRSLEVEGARDTASLRFLNSLNPFFTSQANDTRFSIC